LQYFFKDKYEKATFEKRYLPLFRREGFYPGIYPNLSFYVDIPYEGKPTTGWLANREHFIDERDIIYTNVINEEETKVIGLSEEQLNLVKPSKCSHELGHFIHVEYGTIEDSDFWIKAQQLSKGKIRRQFNLIDQGNYRYIPAYEDFANYFEDILEGRIKNDAFMNWIRSLMDVYFITYDINDEGFKLENGKSYLWTRKIIEDLVGKRFKGIWWDKEYKKVYIYYGLK